jgi:hypothetical protein
MVTVRRFARTGILFAALAVGTACKDEQTRVAEAAARQVASGRVLGPTDLQLMSLDRTVALEVIGDSVHVYMANSSVSVPATYIENLRYADGRLRFDIRGIGVKMFEVGDGREGAVFTQVDAVNFVSTVLERQNAIENRR